jgi:hypothetical protein
MKRLFQSLYTASLAAALALSLTACKPDEGQQLVQGSFPHQPHHENEISCDSCHEMQEQGITMPTLDTCTTCHDLTDEEVFRGCNECHAKVNVQLGDEQLTSLVDHTELYQEHLPENWYDVKYQHQRFLTAESDCLACHQGVTQTQLSSLENLPSMETAMDFHDQMGYSNECSVCHLELTVYTEPPSHDAAWPQTHGRFMEFEDKESCLLCHQEETCYTCHDLEEPRDHTNLFRRKTHGLKASFDRSRCLVCHRNDECQACHLATADPIPAAPYHTPDASCLTCHSPLAAQGPAPRPPQRFFKPMPHRMMMGLDSDTCLECHQF